MLNLTAGLLLALSGSLYSTETRASTDIIEESARYLSQDRLDGRQFGKQGNIDARNYLVAKMQELKIEPAGDNLTFLQNFTGGANLVGIIRPAYDTSRTQLPTVMIGAHFDHVNHCHSHKKALSKVCNGAADNAAAVAAILGAVKQMRNNIQSPVAVVFWDGEEQGLIGSRTFAKKPSFDVSALRLYINLDIVGSNLMRGLESHTFAIGAESGGERLINDIQVAAGQEKIKVNQASYAFGHYRSDMTSFVLAGYKLPFVFFSDGDGNVYHTDADEYENLNMMKVRAVSRTVGKLAISTAEVSKENYQYTAPIIHLKKNTLGGIISGSILGLRNGIVYPTFQDVKTTYRLLGEALQFQQENQLSAGTIAHLSQEKETLKNFIDAGPYSYGMRDSMKIANAAAALLETSKSLRFIP